jgi:hypothetical protein
MKSKEVSHRRLTKFGEKQFILSRSTVVHLLRLHCFSHKFGEALPARMTVFGRAGIAIGFGMSSIY